MLGLGGDFHPSPAFTEAFPLGWPERILSALANDLDEKNLKKVFDQIGRDMPAGRAQHADDRALVEAARPFEAGLKALTGRHPQLLKAFGKHSKWVNQMGSLGGGNHFIEG